MAASQKGNEAKSRETFGTDPKYPPVSRGQVRVFGNMVKDGQLDPGPSVSVNTKTGRPYKGSQR